ncbi:MAG: GTP-binding protein, partial [Deltaproteobacteria bacterium]|nr:GTP-binding protein [Deltaproteobacteria bacterium]
LIGISAEINAEIDFPDEIGDHLNKNLIVSKIINEAVKPLAKLLENYEKGHVYQEGVRLVVAGKPNVGKSSLMNRMANKERAIVTDLPGTTRDVIEEIININGIPAIISDTAGLHDSSDPVEVLGIKKAYEQIKISDIVLFMIDASINLSKEDYKIQKDFASKDMILVINKIDLLENDIKIKIPDQWKKIKQVRISALYDRGIDDLKKMIEKTYTDDFGQNVQNKIIPNLRHKIIIEKCLTLLSKAKHGIQDETPFELIALDIKDTIDSLNEITGISLKEELLDRIFSRFCIGK